MDQKEVSNTFWYNIAAGTFPSNWNIAEFAATMSDYLQGAYCNASSDEVMSRGCEVVVNNGAGSLGVAHYNEVAGSIVSLSLPIDVAAIVRKISDHGGKTGQGRWYFPGIPQQYTDQSYLNNDGITAYGVLATALQTNVTDQTITWQPVTYSRKNNALYGSMFCAVVADLATRRPRRGPF